MRKRFYIVLALLMSLSVWADKSYTLVIDPGHGGKDAGAVGKTSQEKDLNLSLALKVGELVQEQYPDVKVVYTRSTDVFIPLQTRADIANKNNADLFISIHTNSAENKTAHGVETFILGTDKMEANLDVAMRENAVMKLESDYKTTYQGFDPNSIDSYIMFELMQNNYMDQSLQFATQVQNHFVGHLNRSDRGVRQAAFWVLLKTACPSILFEMGFVSNPAEEKYLSSDTAMTQMADALVKAFAAYTHRQAAKSEVLIIESTKTQLSESTSTRKRDVNETITTRKRDVNESDSSATFTVLKADTVQMKKVETKEKTKYYAVQICASKAPLEKNDPKLKGTECEYLQLGEWYKYYTAANTDRKKAEEAQKKLKAAFPDCWIITFEK